MDKIQIYYITSNQSKVKEAERIAEDFGVEIITQNLKINEIKSLDQTFISKILATEAFKKIKKPLIVDDSGLYFENFTQFPGAFTKFLFETIGISGLSKLIGQKAIKAKWKCFLTYIDSDQTISAIGELEGIIKIDQGQNGEEKTENYDSIFYPLKFNKALKDFKLDERSKISHRRNAFEKLFKKLIVKTK